MLTWLPSLRENFPWSWIHFHLLSHLSPLFSGKLLQEWSQSFYQLQLTPICFSLLPLLHWPHSMITRWLPNSQIPSVIWGTFFFSILYCSDSSVIPLIDSLHLEALLPWIPGLHTLLALLLFFKPFFQDLFWGLLLPQHNASVLVYPRLFLNALLFILYFSPQMIPWF